MNQLIISIIIFVITVILFFSGKFSLGLIGLCAAVALQLTGVLDSRNRVEQLYQRKCGYVCFSVCPVCRPHEDQIDFKLR